MQEKVKHLDTLENRLDSTKISPIKIFCRNTLIELIKGISIPNRGVVLSVSTGDGLSDYFVFSNTKGTVRKIVATDIIDNPVDKESIDVFKKIKGLRV